MARVPKAGSANSRNPRRIQAGARDRLRARVLREEDTCHLCDEPVDVNLGPHLPGSPEVDEVVPVSKGGSPILRSNVRLAHRACNVRRSNKTVQEHREGTEGAPPPLHQARATTRDWWTQGG